MEIPYRKVSEYQPVDVARLRPGGSYKQLIEKRTHPIDELVRVHGRIPPDLLQPRPCPTCGSQEARAEIDKDHMQILRCAVCDLVYVSPTFDAAHFVRAKQYGRRQREHCPNRFMFVHRIPFPEASIRVRRLSKARCNRLLTVERGTPATSAICSSFMSSSKRSVSTSR